MDAAVEFTVNVLKAQNRELRERNEVLEIKLTRLETMLGDGTDLPKGLPHLSPVEAEFLKLLIARQMVSTDMAMAALYADRDDPPEPKILDIWISRMRRKLTRHGVVIKRQWGVGWYLPPDSRNVIKHMNEWQ